MGETTEQIKDEIETQRQELGENLHNLEDKVKETMDWRSQFEQRPMAGMGIAFAGGFLLSMMLPGGKSGSRDRSRSADMSNYRVYDESRGWNGGASAGQSVGFTSQTQQKQPSPEMREINETVDNIRGALMGLAATRLRSVLAEALPGFKDEYEEARRKRGNSAATKIQSDDGDDSWATSDQGWSQSEGRATGESPTHTASGHRAADVQAHRT
jgi:hypothetical protein